MDADKENRRDEGSPNAPRKEGVRIIGADEAAAALEAGQAEGRRPNDAPRFGDVPEAPAAANPPAARFPLPDAVDPSQVRRPPLAGSHDPSSSAAAPGSHDPSTRTGAPIATPGSLGSLASPASPEMPHWTEPATGEVPAVLASGSDEDDMEAWSGFAGGGARWRDHPRDWDDAGFEDTNLGDGQRLGALDMSDPEDPYAFEAPLPPPEAEAEPQVQAPGRKRWARISSRPAATRARGGAAQPPLPVDPYGPEDLDLEWVPEAPAVETTQPSRPRRRGSGPAPAAAGRGATGGAAGASALGVRLASGLGIGLLLLLIAQGGPVPLLAMVAMVALVATAEGFGALRQHGYRPATLLGLTATVSIMVGAYVKGETALPLVAVLTVVFALLWYLVGVVRARPLENMAATVGMFMWVGFLSSYAGLLLDPREFPHRHGVAFLMAAVVATVGYDVGGFAFGSRIGRRPLAPSISPNKTWEGLVGGMLMSLVVSAVVVSQISPWTFRDAIALGLVAAVVAPLGDLCQSMVKRDLGLKDMGSILPGHGGMLDRIDALLFVLPATYYLVRILGIG